MCLFNTPKPPMPRPAVQYAAPKTPDVGKVNADAMAMLRRRMATQTTPAAGVGAVNDAGKKTLLGA